jgi:hypothetical protein
MPNRSSEGAAAPEGAAPKCTPQEPRPYAWGGKFVEQPVDRAGHIGLKHIIAPGMDQERVPVVGDLHPRSSLRPWWLLPAGVELVEPRTELLELDRGELPVQANVCRCGHLPSFPALGREESRDIVRGLYALNRGQR